MARTKLFAYGLLMTDMRYHHSHIGGRYSKLQKGTAAGRLFHVFEADCPAMIAGDGAVQGEIFEVDDDIFPVLDHLFGIVPEKPEAGDFVRREIEVEIPGECTCLAWSYLMRAGTLRRRFPKARVIEDGDWRTFYEDWRDRRQELDREELKKKYPGLLKD